MLSRHQIGVYRCGCTVQRRGAHCASVKRILPKNGRPMVAPTGLCVAENLGFIGVFAPTSCGRGRRPRRPEKLGFIGVLTVSEGFPLRGGSRRRRVVRCSRPQTAFSFAFQRIFAFLHLIRRVPRHRVRRQFACELLACDTRVRVRKRIPLKGKAWLVPRPTHR